MSANPFKANTGTPINLMKDVIKKSANSIVIAAPKSKDTEGENERNKFNIISDQNQPKSLQTLEDIRQKDQAFREVQKKSQGMISNHVRASPNIFQNANLKPLQNSSVSHSFQNTPSLNFKLTDSLKCQNLKCNISNNLDNNEKKIRQEKYRVKLNGVIVNSSLDQKSLDLKQTLTLEQSQKIQYKKIGKEVNQTEQIILQLQKLYSIIRGNSMDILNTLKNCNNLNLVKLRIDQIKRLSQGLLFYVKQSNQAISFLRQSLKTHIYWKMVQKIEKQMGMDTLKSFYIVKQVYRQKRKWTHDKSFFIPSQTQLQILNDREFFESAQNFLEQDKHNLLKCYLHLLSFSLLPSDMKFCSKKEELNVLEGNCFCEKQSYSIKNLIIEIIQKYWDKSDSRYTQSEGRLYGIVMKLSKVMGQKQRKRLLQMPMQTKLKSGQIRESDCNGWYLHLFRIIINKSDTDYEQAIKDEGNTGRQINIWWLPKIKQYLDQIYSNTIALNKRDNILKAIFIFKVVQKFKFQYYGQELDKFIQWVVENVSWYLAIMMAQKTKRTKSQMLLFRTFLKLNEEKLSMEEMFNKEVVSQYWQRDNKDLFNVVMSFIRSVIQRYIQSGDLRQLEINLTQGRFCIEQRRQVVRYYFKFLQIGNRIKEVQAEVNDLIVRLGKSDEMMIDIEEYDKLLWEKDCSWQIVMDHLRMLIKIDQNEDQLIYKFSCWMNKAKTLNKNFNQFVRLVNQISNKVTEKGQHVDLLWAVIEPVKVEFNHFLIQQCTKKNKLIGEYNIGYCVCQLKRIVLWIGNNKCRYLSQFLNNLFETMSLCCQNQKNWIQNDGLEGIQIRIMMVGWWNEVKGHSEGHLFQILGFKDLQKVYLALGEHITRHSNPLTIAFYKFTVFYEIGLFEVLKRLGAPDLYHAASESNLNLIDMCDLLEISEKTGEIGLLQQVVVMRGLKWEQNITIEMGKRIFQLLMKMKNAINIDIHCYWIKKMLNQEFFDVDWLREEIFYDYLCYLLCLWAAIKKKSNDLKDKIETQKIFIEELNLFIDLAITIIGPYVEDVSFCGQINPYKMFLLNLVEILISYIPIMRQEIIKLIQKLTEKFKQQPNNNIFANFYQRQLNRLKLKIKQYSLQPIEKVKLLHLQIICNSKSQFQQCLDWVCEQLNSKTRETHNQAIQQNMKEKIQLIKVSHNLLLKNPNYQTTKMLLSQQTINYYLNAESLRNIFLCLSLRLIQRFNFRCLQVKSRHFINNLVSALLKINVWQSQMEGLLELRIIINIIRTVLRYNCITLHLLQSQELIQYSSNIEAKILSLLNDWTLIGDRIMDQKQFKITKLPREKLGNRAFSLWNEIELREKLKIIEEYLKLRNRLSLDISKILQRQIAYILAFVGDNCDYFTSCRTKQELTCVRDYLKKRSSNLNHNLLGQIAEGDILNLSVRVLQILMQAHIAGQVFESDGMKSLMKITISKS